MRARQLGKTGPSIKPLGIGCWAMVGVYGDAPEAEAVATIRRGLEIGVVLLDTADVYGNGSNERLVAKAIKGMRDKAIVGTKVGAHLDTPKFFSVLDGRPEYIKSACDASLQRLGVDVIDLYTLHRIDPRTPVEETVGAMGDLVRAGKVRHIGLSETTVDELRRAHAVFPLTALQSEYSLFSRDPEDGILQATRELGIAFVAYAPLGRGQLTGRVRSATDLGSEDRRKAFPRFSPENIARNAPLVAAVERIAGTKGCTPAQLALAWVLHQGDNVFAIAGSERRTYLEQNAAALDIVLDADDLAEIATAIPRESVAGGRMPENEPAMVGKAES
jgi:aryl-alcohol dehydrogenase-like predicted oxidoreductase